MKRATSSSISAISPSFHPINEPANLHYRFGIFCMNPLLYSTLNSPPSFSPNLVFRTQCLSPILDSSPSNQMDHGTPQLFSPGQ